ncbi:MAG: hypothetical protein ABIQ63_02480, partial [Rhodanobacter sp.]
FSFKLTNLLIHLICGGLIYALLRTVLRRDSRLNQRAALVALLITAVWLLHPLQVSTVLYIVQRMAQLSTLFVLLALIAYVHGREALEQGRKRAGTVWLFLVVPTATVFGVLCKENGALAPLLCAVLELGYFRATKPASRPRTVKGFFWLGLILPVLGATIWYAWPPSRLVTSYSVRTFTLTERLLSEPRALFDYMGALLLPRGPTLGVYTDGFPVSSGLLHPATTLWALIGLLALVALALSARRRAPAVFTGIAFYLAAHVMESSVFPLELYFEHRNYLPSVGFFLAVAGALKWLFDKLPKTSPGSSQFRILVVGAVALCAMLATATAARAWVWQSWSTMVRQAIVHHPGSVRAQFDNLNIVWNLKSPHQTRQLLDRLAKNSNPETRNLAVVYIVLQECRVDQSANPESVARVAAIAGSKLQLADMQVFEQLGGYLRGHECAGLSKIEFANVLRKIVDTAPQPQTNTAVWRTRFMAADLYARGGKPLEAQRQLELTWHTGVADAAVGVLFSRVQIFNRDYTGARLTRAQLGKRIPRWNRRGQAALATIDQLLPR